MTIALVVLEFLATLGGILNLIGWITDRLARRRAATVFWAAYAKAAASHKYDLDNEPYPN